jgi:hypothetical protein
MGLTDWGRAHPFALAAVALVAGTIAAVSASGAVAWAVLVVLSVWLELPTEALGSLLPVFLVGVVVATPIALVAFVSLTAGLFAAAADWVDESLRAWVLGARDGWRWLVATAADADLPGLSDLASQVDTRTARERADARIDGLSDRYARGELSWREFERRVEQVLAEEGVGWGRESTADDRVRDSGDDRSKDHSHA